MKKATVTADPAKISAPAAWAAIVSAVAALLFLASLHILSPEFNPSWRVVSEYALGHYGWVLSLMFFTWGASSWALAVAIWSQVKTKWGKIGLWLLIISGVGDALAAFYDIRHDIMHNVAGTLGIGGLPIAAILISVSLGRTTAWAPAKKKLLWLAHLTWISIVLMGVALVAMTVQVVKANGGKLPQQAPTTLPPGVVGLVGWANRFLVFAFCLWMIVVAWQAITLRRRSA